MSVVSRLRAPSEVKRGSQSCGHKLWKITRLKGDKLWKGCVTQTRSLTDFSLKPGSKKKLRVTPKKQRSATTLKLRVQLSRPPFPKTTSLLLSSKREKPSFKKWKANYSHKCPGFKTQKVSIPAIKILSIKSNLLLLPPQRVLLQRKRFPRREPNHLKQLSRCTEILPQKRLKNRDPCFLL